MSEQVTLDIHKMQNEAGTGVGFGLFLIIVSGTNMLIGGIGPFSILFMIWGIFEYRVANAKWNKFEKVKQEILAAKGLA